MLPTFHNRKLQLERRRELRRSQTEAERRLWLYLRCRRLAGFKFHRQYGVGPYILDFYCAEARLAIELDGSQHLEPSQAAYDRQRASFLEALGIRVVRFWNDDVLRDTDAVLEAVQISLENDLP